MKFYIISNVECNENKLAKWLKTEQISDNDIFIHCNHAKNYELFIKHVKNKQWLICNQCSGDPHHYWTRKEWYDNEYKYFDFFISLNDNIFKMLNYWNSKNNIQYPAKKYPTGGFSVYRLIKLMFNIDNIDIKLINFFNPDNRNVWPDHSYQFEDIFYMENNVPIIDLFHDNDEFEFNYKDVIKQFKVKNINKGKNMIFKNGENIMFIGDCRTQGAGSSKLWNRAYEPTFRYHLWKYFVDSGIEYKPIGSMIKYFNFELPSKIITPDYRGQTFNNRSEGHGSYQLANFSGLNYKGNEQCSDPFSAYYNNGKIRCENPHIKEWLSSKLYENQFENGNIHIDHVVFLIGNTDLYKSNITTEQLFQRFIDVIDEIKSVSPDTKFHICPLMYPINDRHDSDKKGSDEFNKFLLNIENKVLITEYNINVVNTLFNNIKEFTSYNTLQYGHYCIAQEINIANQLAKYFNLQRTCGITNNVNGLSEKTDTFKIEGENFTFNEQNKEFKTVNDSKLTISKNYENEFSLNLKIQLNDTNDLHYSNNFGISFFNDDKEELKLTFALSQPTFRFSDKFVTMSIGKTVYPNINWCHWCSENIYDQIEIHIAYGTAAGNRDDQSNKGLYIWINQGFIEFIPIEKINKVCFGTTDYTPFKIVKIRNAFKILSIMDNEKEMAHPYEK